MTDVKNQIVLAVDLGSGGPKIGYVTVSGNPLWWHYERGDAVGGAESQNPNDWWDLIVKHAQAGLAQPEVNAEDARPVTRGQIVGRNRC